MAIISLSEFGSVSKTNYGTEAVDCLGVPTAAQDVTIPGTSTPTSAVAFGAGTNFVRIFAAGDCQIAVLAGGVFERFPAGTIEVRQVTPNGVLSVKAY
jgi:hypothetical protein